MPFVHQDESVHPWGRVSEIQSIKETLPFVSIKEPEIPIRRL
jgi:hypothetical protein